MMDSLLPPLTQALNNAVLHYSQKNGLDTPLTIKIEDLEIPPDPTLGDFAFPCFKLSKLFRKSPPDVAKALLDALSSENLLSNNMRPEIKGPYLNFFLMEDFLKNEILKHACNSHYSMLPRNSKSKWVIEFSSPNLAKPMNIYHLRGTALGAALIRMARYRGFEAISINHLGDWGTPMGKMAIAFQLYEKDLPKNPKIEDLVQLYIRFNQEESESPELEAKAREAFAALEKGDPKITAIWKKCVEVSLFHLTEKIYKPLGIEFDYIWPESFYQDKMEPVLEDLRKKGVLEKDAGAEIVRVTNRDGKEIPPCILVKTDGSTIYATRDIASAVYRHEQFQFAQMSYIVGGEQRLHFEQLFGVLRVAGFEWEKTCELIPTGLYRFKDSKMSTRKGNFITLLSVLEQAKEEVKKVIASRPQAHFSENELEDVSQKVAIGALVFNDLSVDPARDVEFDLARVLDFDGETGPYLQYAHTRCLSLIEKAKKEQTDLFPLLWTEETALPLSHEKEVNLIRTIGKLPLILDKSLQSRKASVLTSYLIDLTKAFNQFYRECRVLGTDKKETKSRLLLTLATQNTLGLGLKLLGIPLPEKM